MSQHIFHTTVGGIEVEVIMGYDRPLNRLFLTIEKLEENQDSDEDNTYLWSNLDVFESNTYTFDDYVNVLTTFDITLPVEMLNEVKQDAVNKVGNKIVHHSVDSNGNYVRK